MVGAARLALMRLEEKVAKARNPEYWATMIREALNDPPPINFSQIFLLSDGEARYDHRPDESLQAHAQRLGIYVYHPPAFVYDLPAGAGRYVQKSSGYQYTLVNGQVFMEGLDHVGTFAGRVLRSA